MSWPLMSRMAPLMLLSHRLTGYTSKSTANRTSSYSCIYLEGIFRRGSCSKLIFHTGNNRRKSCTWNIWPAWSVLSRLKGWSGNSQSYNELPKLRSFLMSTCSPWTASSGTQYRTICSETPSPPTTQYDWCWYCSFPTTTQCTSISYSTISPSPVSLLFTRSLSVKVER